MLYLFENHEVVGSREAEFESAFREEYLPRLGRGEEARLLYFLHHAHGTGASYNVLTVTAVRDGAAWEALARSVDEGELRAWAEAVDGLRHDVTAKLVLPLPWSPLQRVALGDVPSDGAEHELSVFMEDTVWPYEGRLEDYVAAAGNHYAVEMASRDSEGKALLRIQAAFRTAFGSHRRREIVLWQKITQPKALAPLITREVPEVYRKPGTWMHDALSLRDRWESRLLRTSSWSPWH